MDILHLDTETYSELDLTKVGTHRYLEHTSSEVMLTPWALNDDPVQVIEGPPTPELREILEDPSVIIEAYNAEFERLVLRYLCNLTLHPDRFDCTMTLAWALSFVGRLDEVGAQIGFPQDKRKNAEGRRLMLKFGKPRRPSKHDDRTRWTKDMDPEGWAGYVEYARQDVVASRAIWQWVQQYPWPQTERLMWHLDQDINDRGWPLDMTLVRNANAIRKAEETRLRSALKRVTGLANPNSTQQLGEWLREHNAPMENLQKATVAEALAGSTLPESVREALTLRQELARSTPKKWDALERGATADDDLHYRIQGTLEFGAAQRTQRWGGRIFQPQNLYAARSLSPVQGEELADLLSYADRDTVQALYGDTMTALANGIRSAVTAPPGYDLVVCDLASIESRVLGWLSGCNRINGLFAEGRDTYRDLAARLFNIDYDTVTKQQRTFAKPPDLGCGYMLGGPGLVAYAAGMGVEMSEDFARFAVGVWRASNPEVVAMWEWLQQAAINTIRTGESYAGYGVRIRRDPHFLFIDLPSGRAIAYYKPFLALNKWDRPSVRYWGRLRDEAGAWGEVWTHPGKITENIVQAVARDILVDAMLEISDDLNIVGHVHDEIVTLQPENESEATLRELERIMSSTPAWAPGLVLGAEGFICKRYRKG